MTTFMMEAMIALVRCNSYTIAAQELGISQSYLSKIVKKTEDEFGVKIVYRDGNSVSLTDRGRLLLEQFQFILEEYTFALNDIAQLKRMEQGQLSIGINPNLYSETIKLIHASAAEAAIENLQVFECANQDLLNLLDRKRVDIVIGNHFHNLSDDYEIHIIDQGSWQLLVPEDHPLAQFDQVNWTAARDYDFIFPRYEDHYEFMKQCCKQNGLYPRIMHRSSGLTNISCLVRNGFGVALVVNSPLRSPPEKSLKFIRLFPEIQSNTCIVTRKNNDFPLIYRLVNKLRAISQCTRQS